MRFAAVAVLVIGLVTPAAAQARPNVVFILIDDLGWADLGCYGNEYNETPHLDRLAREGLRFTQAYAAAPLCSPTRAAILTGKYPARLGITDWIPGDYRPHMPMECPVTKQYLEHSEVTMAEALKEAGYATAYVGKWHLGETSDYYPVTQGFDYSVGAGHRPANRFPPYELDNLPEGPKDEYITDRLGEESAKLIAQLAPAEAPYFLFLGHYAVHAPIVPRPDKVAKYRAKGRDQRSADYAAMLESVDDSVGAIMDAVESSGEADNTIFIFTSDNGGYYQATENWPLRGYKSNLYEGGLRVPLIIRWPAKIDAGSSSDVPFNSPDFYPTLLSCIGLPQQPAQHVDGQNLEPVLTAQAVVDHGPMLWHFPHYQTPARGEPGSVLRQGNWKLLYFYDGDRSELYDLATDPGEQRNLARLMPEKAAGMRDQLKSSLKEMGAQLPARNPRSR